MLQWFNVSLFIHSERGEKNTVHPPPKQHLCLWRVDLPHQSDVRWICMSTDWKRWLPVWLLFYFHDATNPDEIRRVGSTAVSLWSFEAMDFQGLKMVFQLLSRWHSSMLTLKHMFPQSHINTDDQKAVAEPHQAAFNRGKHAIHKKEAHSGSTVSLLGLIFTVLLLGFSCFPLFLWSLHYKHKQRVSVSAHTGD